MYKILLFVFIASMLYSCTKKNETLETENVLDYYPLTIGKAIRYKLDSTNYIGYNLNPVFSTYYCRDSVEAQVTDALGRKAFRVVRSYKKLLTDAEWVPRASFMVTPLEKSVEVVDDINYRWIKLQGPVKEGFYWNGNRYIETSSPSTLYLDGWEYIYEDIKAPKTYSGITFPETLTVRQINDSTINDPTGYSNKTVSFETYAKGVGLVYKDYLHWNYQPATSTTTPAYIEGYGIRLTVIGHN